MLLLLVGLLLLAPILLILHLTRFWRAFPLILLLGGLSYYAYVVVGRTHDHRTAVMAAGLVPAAIVAFGLWRPASSKLALWIADGVTGAAICAKWMGLGATVLTLASAQLNVVVWLQRVWWVGAVGLGGWIVERLMTSRVRASIMREPGAVDRVRWLSELDGQ